MTGAKSIIHLSIQELHDGLRSSSFTVVDIIQQHLNRTNTALRCNAIIKTWADEALKKASELDERFKKEGPALLQSMPLFGIPFSIKGSFAVENSPWTGGSYYRKDIKATMTATAIQRCIDAGAIPICLTNIPEASTWIETTNILYGRTRHPLDPKRTPGGSSGGEAVALATGVSVFGIGTDMGGSIRIPAAFCGVSGHKPSSGRIPGTGQWPTPFGKLWNYSVTGPLARYAKDLKTVYSVLIGPDQKDPSVLQTHELKPLDDSFIQKTQFFFLDEIPGMPVSKQIHDALDHARCAIQAKGGSVQKMDPSLFKSSAQIWFASLIENAPRGPKFSSILGNGPEINPLIELIKFPLGLSHHTFACLMLALMEMLSDFPFGKKHKRQLYEQGLQLKNKLNKILGTNGVLICPVYPTPAPKHHIPKLRPFAWIYSGIFNALELPATAFPIEYSEITGRAYSIQAVAAHGMDHLTLKTAELLESGPRILSSSTK